MKRNTIIRFVARIVGVVIVIVGIRMIAEGTINYKATFRRVLQGAVAGNHDDLEIILELYTPLIDKHCYIDGRFDEDLRQYTDAVDDVLIKFTKARKKKMTVQYI